MNEIYRGILSSPSQDFQAVRDNRRALPFYIDIDLSTARTESSPLLVTASGNVFYADADPNSGICSVEFQDTGSDAAAVRLYVSGGAIFNIPFTQFKITNAAQAGKKIRLVYGVDVDFQPGSVTQIALSGNLINVDDYTYQSSQARNYNLFIDLASAANATQYFGLKNIFGTQVRVNYAEIAQLTGGMSGGTAPVPTFQLCRVLACTEVLTRNALNTKTLGTQLCGFSTTAGVAPGTGLAIESRQNSIDNKATWGGGRGSAIYVAPNDGLFLYYGNGNVAGNVHFYINFDVLPV